MAGREPYSPKYRTALVLTGTGTAGAYHAGVLRALAEAGVRIDLVAGHGAGAIGACFTAIEGGPALWSEDGCWRQKAVAGFYAWRPALRALGWASAAALALVLVPLAGLAFGLVAFPASLLLSLLGLDAGRTLADSYAALVRDAFSPGGLASWVPRASLLLAAAVLAALAVAASRARVRGRTTRAGEVLVAGVRGAHRRRLRDHVLADGALAPHHRRCPRSPARLRRPVAPLRRTADREPRPAGIPGIADPRARPRHPSRSRHGGAHRAVPAGLLREARGGRGGPGAGRRDARPGWRRARSRHGRPGGLAMPAGRDRALAGDLLGRELLARRDPPVV